jgi:MOSC domain-containing protein YiiM
MNVVSVNVGLPRQVIYEGKTITTGIFKEPVEGRITLRRLNLDGDRQADLSVHGGPSKAVYAYPIEHYEYWREQYTGVDLPWGMFGENLTVEGLREDGLNIGDRLRIGSAQLTVTGPRLPCYKLAAKFGRDDIIKRFLHSGRTGFYLAVLQEGEIAAADDITVVGRDEHAVTVADITRLYVRDKDDVGTLRRAVQVEALPESWRGYFQKRIEKLENESAG